MLFDHVNKGQLPIRANFIGSLGRPLLTNKTVYINDFIEWNGTE